MTTQKWTKGSFNTSRWNGEELVKDVPVSGYVSSDTDTFAIHRKLRHFVITHLESGMKAASCTHLQVAKQMVSDLLAATENWEEKNGFHADLDPEVTKTVRNIRAAGRNYTNNTSELRPIEKYILERDSE